MQAIRVTQTLDSETLYLPQLRPLMGQRVEIIVLLSDPVDLESIEPQPPSESPGATGGRLGPQVLSAIHVNEQFPPSLRATSIEELRQGD